MKQLRSTSATMSLRRRTPAVPIFRTVANAFDCVDNGTALFHLKVEGRRYERISNPANRVLEPRPLPSTGGSLSSPAFPARLPRALQYPT